MMIDEKKRAVETKSRTHLEMDEIEELLELARKTDERSWCILTLAFNHGLRVSECAGGAPAIPGKTRPAIPPLTLSDIDMRHRTIRVRRLKGSLETTQAFVEHRGKPALSDYACLKTYLMVRINDGSDFLFTGPKRPTTSVGSESDVCRVAEEDIGRTGRPRLASDSGGLLSISYAKTQRCHHHSQPCAEYFYPEESFGTCIHLIVDVLCAP